MLKSIKVHLSDLLSRKNHNMWIKEFSSSKVGFWPFSQKQISIYCMMVENNNLSKISYLGNLLVGD